MEYMAGTDPDSSSPTASFYYVMIRILHSTSQETVPIGESDGLNATFVAIRAAWASCLRRRRARPVPRLERGETMNDSFHSRYG